MTDGPPPPPPPPPPSDGWPAGPPQPPPAEDTRSPVVLVLVIGGAIVVLVVLALVAAITIPAFLNQRERALQAELTSAVRSAAIEVEVAAIEAGGRYDVITNFDGLVNGELQSHSFAVELDRGSSLTWVARDAFAICAEHNELEGSVAYVSDEGGLLDYRDAPCP